MSSQFDYASLPIEDFFKVASDLTCRWVTGIKKGLRVAKEHLHGFFNEGIAAFKGPKMDLPGSTIAGLEGEGLSDLVSAANMVGQPQSLDQKVAAKVAPDHGRIVLPEKKPGHPAKGVFSKFLTLGR